MFEGERQNMARDRHFLEVAVCLYRNLIRKFKALLNSIKKNAKKEKANI